MKISKQFGLILIENNLIPFKGYSYINICGLIFCRRNYISETIANHEKIHTHQQKEMLVVFFYIWYLVEWLILLINFGDSHKAYRNISFEKEARTNENNLEYLKSRKLYSWIKFI